MPEARMTRYRVYVFLKLIKACMCSVRGFARTAHTLYHPPPNPNDEPREPTLGVYLPKPLTFSPGLRLSLSAVISRPFRQLGSI